MPERRDPRKVIERIERELFVLVRRISLFGALPFMLVVVALFARSKHLTPWLLLELASVAGVMASVTLPWLSHRGRRLGLTLGLTGIATMSLLHFGPNLGVGMFFAIAGLAGAFLFGRRGAIATTAVLLCSLAFAAIASTRGLLAMETTLPSTAAWLRMSASALIPLVGCVSLFTFVQRAFHRSVLTEIAARAEQRAAASEREQVLRAGLSAQRLESLGRLTGGVAHDFNNALVVVQSAVELLAETADEGERAELLAEVTAGVERATATARQLLVFAKHQPSDGAGADPVEVLGRLEQTLKRFMPANVVVRVQPQPAPRLGIDAGLLEQVLLNLALNARDAMPRGGGLELSCRKDPIRRGALLEVADEGDGMTPEVRARIFEPFFSTKGESGTGLGLAMVWGIVERHRGKIDVESSPGFGARFTLFLPAGATAPATPPPPPLRSLGTQGRLAGKRLLLVEDQGSVRDSIARTLQRAGAEVTAVESVSAMAKALSRGSYALLVTDGMLSDGSAADTIALFRATRARGPVVVCSGHLSEDLSQHLAKTEHRFLAKPFSPDSLLRTVDGLLAGRGPTTGAQALASARTGRSPRT